MKTQMLIGALLLTAGCGGATDTVDETKPPEAVGSTEQSVTYNALNCVCANDLWLRDSPGGNRVCTLFRYEVVNVRWPPSGSYADAQGFSTTQCQGVRGWALSSELSQSCCR